MARSSLRSAAVPTCPVLPNPSPESSKSSSSFLFSGRLLQESSRTLRSYERNRARSERCRRPSRVRIPPSPPPRLWVQRLPARIRGWIRKSPRIRGVLAVDVVRYRTRDCPFQWRFESGCAFVSVGHLGGSVWGSTYDDMRWVRPKPYAEGTEGRRMAIMSVPSKQSRCGGRGFDSRLSVLKIDPKYQFASNAVS